MSSTDRIRSNPFHSLYLAPYEPRFVEGMPNSIFGFRKLGFWCSNNGAYYLKSKSRKHVRSFLKTWSTLDTRCIEKLIRASRQQMERLEAIIHGVMAAIRLSKIGINVATQRRIIRKVFRKVSSENFEVNDTCKDWKELSNFIFVTATGLETLEPPKLRDLNVFGVCRKKIVSSFLSCGKSFPLDASDRGSIEKIAQFCQTRFLPSAGRTGIKNSIKKFIETTSSVFEMDWKTESRIFKAATMVAESISISNGGKWPLSCAHISLASSGDYDYESAKGGRAAKIHDDVSALLEQVPAEDKVMNLPFNIRLVDITGVPRWRTWCRAIPVIAPPDAKFGAVVSSYGESFLLLDRRWGCDEALGSQIFAVALLKAREWGVFNEQFELNYEFPPIPSRVVICPEAGLKARTVTITKWWAVLLQQPLGHFLRETLSAHPAARDGLTNDDQARQYVKRLSALNYHADWDDYTLLSSDLSEATDAIPHRTALALVGALLEKVGLLGKPIYKPYEGEAELSPNPLASDPAGFYKQSLAETQNQSNLFDNEYVRLAMLIGCSPRKFTVGRRSWTSNRGIMMGEPLAKGVLTLLNLACEELAFHEYCADSSQKFPFGECLENVSNTKGYPHYLVPWRCYTVIGDDHSAYGPKPYTRRVTENHVAWGSKLSRDKHGSGNIVKVCEEVIIKPSACMARSAYPTEAQYDTSLVIDSVKLRLMVLCHRSRDVDQDSNPAVGKGLALSEKLSYFASPRRDREWKLMVIRAFVHSYWKKLPRGLDLHHMYLPKALGGLGLGVDLDDIRNHVDQSGYFTRMVLYVISNQDQIGEQAVRKIRHMLTSLNSVQRATHGYSFPSVLADSVTEWGWEMACMSMEVNPPRMVNIRDNASFYTGRKIHKDEIRKAGFQVENDVLKALTRGAAFNEIFTKNAKLVEYRPAPYGARMAAVLAYIDEQLSISDFDTSSLPPNSSANPFALSIPQELDELIDRFSIEQELAVSFEDTPLNEIEALVQSPTNPHFVGQPMHFVRKTVQKTFYELVEKGLPSLRLPRLLETNRQPPELWGEFRNVKSLLSKTSWFILDDG